MWKRKEETVLSESSTTEVVQPTTQVVQPNPDVVSETVM